MRFHVVNLPHTQATDEFSWCAYTGKIRRFCDMMYDLGHEVYLYASEENDCKATEIVPIISREEQQHFWPKLNAGNVPRFDRDEPGFNIMNYRAIQEINKRSEPEDFFANIAGHAYQPIDDNTKGLVTVEFGVGYEGIYCDYCCFESYCWMEGVYSGLAGGAARAIGRWMDTVIPNSWHPHEFPRQGTGAGNYLLYVGRMVQYKGMDVIAEIAARTDMPVKMAGDGPFRVAGTEYLGHVSPQERSRLMEDATAVLTPTTYLDPFCGVHIEAQLAGSPVITTDWGIFAETVVNGENGWRCRSPGEFQWAINHLEQFDRAAIRRNALAKWSTDVTKHQYQEWFERIQDFRANGWVNSQVRRPGR